MELQTQILNIPICHDLGYTPITKAKISDLPIGTIDNGHHYLYKSRLNDFRNDPDVPKGYYEHEDDKFYDIELKTSITLNDGKQLYVTEISVNSEPHLDWHISLYDKGTRLLYVCPNYVEAVMRGETGERSFSIGSRTMLTQDIGDIVRFKKPAPGINQSFFKGTTGENELGYNLYVYGAAECPPVYFDGGVLNATDKEEAIEYIDDMLKNLLAAKQSILNTPIVSDDVALQYCNSFAGIITEEDVLFKGFSK